MKRTSSRPGRNVIAHALALVIAFIACQATVQAKADDAGVRVPPFERVQLDNGAVLLLMERHDVPLIAFNAVIRGGALTDPAQQSGMSQLLVHLLEKGAGKRDAFAFADALASVGATIATDADTESTVIQGWRATRR